MAADESAVCKHTERNEEVQFRSVTEEKRLAFAKQTRCCCDATSVIRENRKTQRWVKAEVNILHSLIHYVGQINEQI
jgi:hypothetical protein